MPGNASHSNSSWSSLRVLCSQFLPFSPGLSLTLCQTEKTRVVRNSAEREKEGERESIFEVFSPAFPHGTSLSKGLNGHIHTLFSYPTFGGTYPFLVLKLSSQLLYDIALRQCTRLVCFLIVIIMHVTFLQTLGGKTGKGAEEQRETKGGKEEENTEDPGNSQRIKSTPSETQTSTHFKVPCYLLYSCTE